MSELRQDIPKEIEDLSNQVIGVAIEVHKELGPGLAEKIYEESMCHELQIQKIEFEQQVPLRVKYKGCHVGDHRLDLLIGSQIVVELKAVERVADLHLAQLVSYLRAGPYPLGLLLNFGGTLMKDGVFRRINSSCLSSFAPSQHFAPSRTKPVSSRTKSI